jgi:hypothetical protein
MKRIAFTSLAVLALWGSGLNFASAQFGGLGQAPPRQRPTVSPFINMGQGANAYYGIIKPQIDANRSVAELQNSIQRLNPDGSLQGQLTQGVTGLGGLQTGHSVTFLNTGNYFPASPGGTGASSITGFGAGLGGTGFGVGATGFGTTGLGVGNTGVRTFFSGNLNQPLIRP